MSVIPPKLRRWQKWLLYGATAAAWLSGTAWLVLQWEIFGPDVAGARPLCMRLHGAAAMAFLVALGALLTVHVPAGWIQRRQRPLGSTLLAVCAVLVITGWGLYYVAAERPRELAGFAHRALGLALPALICVHVLLGREKKRR